MDTPLQNITLSNGSLPLTPDVLGNTAYSNIVTALNLTSGTEITNCTMSVPPSANLLMLAGTLPSFMGLGAASVNFYLFEVSNLLGETERHAIFVFTDLPAGFTPATLLKPFCGSSGAELSVLSTLNFAVNSDYLLYSTLAYDNAALYQNPAFPPSGDTGLPAAVQTFISGVKPELTEGYLFSADLTLQSSISLPVQQGAEPDVLELGSVLTAIGLGSLCTTGVAVTGQLSLSGTNPEINLWYAVGDALTASGIPLNPSISAVGVGFYLGSGVLQIPVLELQGSLTLASTPSEVTMSFQPYYNQLTASFTELPDFADLASHFTGTPLTSILGNFLPDGAIDALGLLEVVSIDTTIDCTSPSVETLNFSLVTEHPLALFDGIDLQPALIVRLSNPFQSFYTAEVDVVGKWFTKSSSLDTIMMFDKGETPDSDSLTFMANLSIGSGIDFLDIAENLFHRQISGLPTLDISDLEITAQRTGSGQTASDSLSIAIDVSSGWNLDGLDLGLEDVSLNIDFSKANPVANWELGEVSAQGTLEIGPVFFNLSADYDASDMSWTFTGGTVPDEQLNLGAFLTSITGALGIEEPADFLTPFNEVNIIGCYIQYQTSSTASSSWQLTVSTDFAGGSFFGGLGLDEIVLNFSRTGTATSFSFDATAPSPPTQGVGSLLSYLDSSLDINVTLPTALTASDIFLTGVSASYDSSSQNYNFIAYLNFGSNALVQLSIDIVSQTLNGVTTKNKYLGGSLVLNPGANQIVFDLAMITSGGASDMVATLQAQNGIDIDLGEIVNAIDSSVTGLNGLEIEIKNALFAHSGAVGNTPAKSIFAVDMGAEVNLSALGSLPIIGAEMASLASLDLGFQVIYAFGGDYQQSDLQIINQSLGNPSIRFPEQTIAQGKPVISTSVRVGSNNIIDTTVPVQPSPDNSGSLSPSGGNSVTTDNPGSTSTSTDQGGVTWFPLNKDFGPVHVNRLGLAFDKNNMAVNAYLDGGITAGPVSFDLLGLDVGIPLTGSGRFIPTFDLQGLGLNYQNGPLDIGGALFKQTTNGITEFDGFVTIRTEELQIGAIGSYAKMSDGDKSLFVYAVLGDPLGGPAFFFVTGLAAGFGYNRQLLPPAITDVQNFPLITEALSPAPQPQAGNLTGIHDYVDQQLQLLQKSVVPTSGEYFFAAGIRFTSFELIDGFLLGIVQFGNEFRIDLLGLANASMPPACTTDPLAEAQLAVIAHYVPSEGSVWVQGQLTSNSFILSSNCHLTGGFALACWTGGAYEGQFVTTIGGYAQNYQVPSYFPTVPQVGFNWQVNGNLGLKGGGYFALVPHALMAGGSLQAIWESGSVKAWFIMGADFLIEWKPFHYAADIYVELGAELTIHFFGTHHVTIDASADLEVWGPEFGGHAAITVKVIGIHFHFSIDFGASSSYPPPLKWEEFDASFLPADSTQWLGVNIQSGLVRTVTDLVPGEADPQQIWIVKSDELNIATNSVLPVKSVVFSLDGNPATPPDIPVMQTGIAPMDLQSIYSSEHGISITRITNANSAKEKLNASSEQLMLLPASKKVPVGMWGTKRTPDLNPQTNVLDAVSGFSIVPSVSCLPDPAAITVSRASLAYETEQLPGFDLSADTGSFAGTPSSWSDISTVLAGTASARQSAIAQLGYINFKENFNQPLTNYAPVQANLGTWSNQ